MKFKKLTTISISIFFIVLFVAANSNAITTTHTVEYPTYVKLGESFTINIVFDYELDCNCLYGLYIWLHSMVNDEITSHWTTGGQKYIYKLENYPRPSNVSWTLDTLVMYYGTLETDDVIKFKIVYKTGYDNGYIITFEARVITSHYEITIGEETTTNETNTANFTIPVLILSAALIFTKRKKREELK